jgi:putative addiction module CopG family antidote
MSTRTSLNVSLTPELEEFTGTCVASGQYQSASEVVREGLRLLHHQAELRRADLARAHGRGAVNAALSTRSTGHR